MAKNSQNKPREASPQPQDTGSPKTKNKGKTKKKKVVYVDDGHTVYDMSNVGKHSKKDKDDVGLSRRERRAAIFAALAFYMPRVLLVLGCFALVGVLMYFWLT